MTSRVEPEMRKAYKVMAAGLGIKMEEFQRVALILSLARLTAVPASEREAVWKALEKEAKQLLVKLIMTG